MTLQKIKQVLIGDAPVLTLIGYAGALLFVLFGGDSIENIDKGEILKGLAFALMGRLSTGKNTAEADAQPSE